MLLVSMIIDSSRGLFIDSISAENTKNAIKDMLVKHNLFEYQVNELCITNVDTLS